MAFTYPTCCLELSEGAENIVIKNTKGEIINPNGEGKYCSSCGKIVVNNEC